MCPLRYCKEKPGDFQTIRMLRGREVQKKKITGEDQKGGGGGDGREEPEARPNR